MEKYYNTLQMIYDGCYFVTTDTNVFFEKSITFFI